MINTNPLFPNDDEMTLNDLALYAAGQLDIYYQLIDNGLMSIAEAAEQLHINAVQLRVMRSVWIVGGVLARRDATKKMMIAEAARSIEN